MLIENDFEHDDRPSTTRCAHFSPAPAAGRDPVSQPGHPPDAHPPLPDPRGGPRLPGAPTADPASARPRLTSRPRRGRKTARRAQLDGRRGGGRALPARAEASATPALDPVAPPPPEPPAEPAAVPAPGPSPDVAIAEEDPMPPPSEPERVARGDRRDARPRRSRRARPGSVRGTGPSPATPGAGLDQGTDPGQDPPRGQAGGGPAPGPRSLEAAAAREGSEARRGGQGGPSRRGPAPGRGEAGRVPRRAPQARRRAGRPRGAADQ